VQLFFFSEAKKWAYAVATRKRKRKIIRKRRLQGLIDSEFRNK